jgi:hypothetical protein
MRTAGIGNARCGRNAEGIGRPESLLSCEWWRRDVYAEGCADHAKDEESISPKYSVAQRECVDPVVVTMVKGLG